MQPADSILFSGGAPGAEAAFGACAERYGVEEVNFTFDGHKIDRHRGVRVLNHEELLAGDVSLEYVSRLMHRRYVEGPTLRKVLQTLWYRSTTARRSTSSARSRRTIPSAAARAGAPSSPSCATSRCTCSTRIAIGGSAGTGRHGTPAATRPHRLSHTCISPAPAPGPSVRTERRRSTRSFVGRSARCDVRLVIGDSLRAG